MDLVCYVKSADIVSRRIQDEVILVPIRNNIGDLQCIHTLNEVGAFIWDSLDHPQDSQTLKAAILAAFDANAEQVEEDLENFLAQLETIGVVQRQPLQISYV